MNTKDFYSFYDLKEIDVLSISSKENDLVILFNADVEMELMANGFRGGFDLSFLQEATFKNVHSSINLSSPIHVTRYEYQDDTLIIQANKETISIPSTEVVIRKIRTNRV
jgi:hypothetical protein